MVPLGCGKLVLRYLYQVLTPPSVGALKWMFTFRVLLSSAKPTQQLTQYPGFKFSSENTCCADSFVALYMHVPGCSEAACTHKESL